MTVQLHLGDCLEVMAGMDANSIDTVITDPPYGLEFMGKEWDSPWKGKAAREFNVIRQGTLGGFKHLPNYDRGNNVQCLNCGKWKFSSNPCTCESPQFPPVKQMAMLEYQRWATVWAAELLRVAKPGAMLLAFGGTRTYHRLACAIEDAGWEIRDCMMWLYGSGFPKSHDVSKAIDKAAGAEREVVGKKPWRNQNIAGNSSNGRGWMGADQGHVHLNETMPATPEAATWDGWGTALKPAWEPIIVAMKPLDGTFAANALGHGVAGLWIDGARIATDGRPLRESGSGDRPSGIYGDGTYGSRATGETTVGRWPANLILDEEAAVMLDEQSGTLKSGDCPNGFSGEHTAQVYGEYAANLIRSETVYADTGGASRFFYQAKASRRERWFFCHICDDAFPASKRDEHTHDKGPKEQDHIFMHPTQKPLELMEYLCKLTKTPTGGVVLDPFMGTGTTGVACARTGRDFIGIDKEYPTYMIAKRRTQDPRDGEPEDPVPIRASKKKDAKVIAEQARLF